MSAQCGGPEWHYADSSCFRVFGAEEEPVLKPWPEAEAHCQEYGGHLARISSKLHNNVASTLCAQTDTGCWIGLTDAASEGSFAWSDGEPVDYENWRHGQPDNRVREQSPCEAHAKGEDCAAIPKDGDQWNDFVCDAFGGDWGGRFPPIPEQPGCYKPQLPFICSKPAIPGALNTRLQKSRVR